MNALKTLAKRYAIESFLSIYNNSHRIEFIKDISYRLNYDFNLTDEIIENEFLDKAYYYFIVLDSTNKRVFDYKVKELIKEVREYMMKQEYTCELCNIKSHHLRINGCEECQKLLCVYCYDVDTDTCKSCVPCE